MAGVSTGHFCDEKHNKNICKKILKNANTCMFLCKKYPFVGIDILNKFIFACLHKLHTISCAGFFQHVFPVFIYRLLTYNIMRIL